MPDLTGNLRSEGPDAERVRDQHPGRGRRKNEGNEMAEIKIEMSSADFAHLWHTATR